LLTYALLIPAFFILANVFSARLEAQQYYDRKNNDRQNQDKVCFYVDENFHGAFYIFRPVNLKIQAPLHFANPDTTVTNTAPFGIITSTFTPSGQMPSSGGER
jgi:hypothetical protein